MSDVLTTGFDSPPPLPRWRVILDFLTANPLVAPAAGLVLGVAVDSAVACPAVVAITFATIGGVLVYCSGRASNRRAFFAHIGLALAAFAFGTVRYDLAMRHWPADHIVHYCRAEPVSVCLRGTVVTTPVIRNGSECSMVWFPELPRTRFVLAVDHVSGEQGPVAASGLLDVSVDEPALPVQAGDHVELLGSLRLTSPSMNPGGTDWALQNRRNGILTQLFCRHAEHVRVLQASAGGWHRVLARLRLRACSSMLEDTFSGDMPGSGFLAAMVLGQRSAIDPALNDAFVRSGTVHYLSVSGAHVGMLVGAIWGVGLLVGATRRSCAAWAMTAATVYALLAEPSPPIFRAAIMTDLACLAILSRRPMRVANWLAASMLILLTVAPTQLFNAGFQLSYGTLFAVIYLSQPLYDACSGAWRRLRGRDDPLLSPEIQQRIQPRPRFSWLSFATHAMSLYLAVGVSAWLAGELLATYHFRQISVWGWFNSLVIMPLVWLVMVMGLVKTLLAGLAPGVGHLVAWPLAGVTKLLIGLVGVLSRAPGAGVPMPVVPASIVIAGFAVCLLFVLRTPLRLNVHAVRLSILAFVGVLAFMMAPRSASSSLDLHFLAVGNGNTTVIELPNGRNLIYDMGCFPPYDLERWTVGPLLARDKCARIDSVLISHANLDHYGGVLDLIHRRRVEGVITTPHFLHASDRHSTCHNLVQMARNQGIPWQTVCTGGRLSGTGRVAVDVLWPPARELQREDENDTSMVVRLTYGGTRILLCGDIEEYAMQELIATADLHAEVLLLPHHGSTTAPSLGLFIHAVDPTYCIRSTGKRGCPPALQDAVGGRQLFSTADHGGVHLQVTAAGTVRIECPCLPSTPSGH